MKDVLARGPIVQYRKLRQGSSKCLRMIISDVLVSGFTGDGYCIPAPDLSDIKRRCDHVIKDWTTRGQFKYQNPISAAIESGKLYLYTTSVTDNKRTNYVVFEPIPHSANQSLSHQPPNTD